MDRAARLRRPIRVRQVVGGVRLTGSYPVHPIAAILGANEAGCKGKNLRLCYKLDVTSHPMMSSSWSNLLSHTRTGNPVSDCMLGPDVDLPPLAFLPYACGALREKT